MDHVTFVVDVAWNIKKVWTLIEPARTSIKFSFSSLQFRLSDHISGNVVVALNVHYVQR